jgi:hypothetical protein
VSRIVVALVADLMDRSRLLAAPGVDVHFVGADELTEIPETDLVVVDLGGRGHLAALAALADRPAGVVVVGFGPHVDEALLAEAEAAGCDRVLPRSRFFRIWPDV